MHVECAVNESLAEEAIKGVVMPGIATHYVFGTDAFPVVDRTIGERADNLAAFLLGSQGPDPLFYLAASPAERSLRRIGSTMHRQKTVELLRVMHERLVVKGESAPLAAYALGFLCHYILDSTVHPLVYAQQQAICSLGLGRLTGEWPHREVHATIETAIDEYVLTTRLGASAATMPPHKTMLRCPAQVLSDISCALAGVVNRVYGIECPDTAFMAAVGLHRASQAALDSKSSGLRRRLDYLPRSGAAVAYVRALSHRPEPLPRTPFTNDDHVAWPHAFAKDKVVSASFDELYALSLAKAQDVLPAFAQHSLDAGLIEGIVEGVNFLGQPCGEDDNRRGL